MRLEWLHVKIGSLNFKVFLKLQSLFHPPTTQGSIFATP